MKSSYVQDALWNYVLKSFKIYTLAHLKQL